MRTTNTIKNIFFSSGGLLISQIITFICRTIFIEILGKQYLGIDALFINIMLMLSLAELGVGQAITFSLYKPLAENDIKKVNSLMALYKKVYQYIGVGIIFVGLMIMPFLHNIAAGANEIENIEVLFLFFVLNSSFTYFYGYKRALITADQKAYKLVPFTTCFLILDFSLRITVLTLTKSYLAYLAIQFVIKLIENIVINKYIDKKYIYINNISSKLSSIEVQVIVKNVKAMLLHKIGDVSLNGTDNIIIATFIGISTVGLYSNYTMILLSIQLFINLIFHSAGASLGNLIAGKEHEKKEAIFDKLNFLAFALFGIGSVIIYFCLPLFIEIWIGNDYLLPNVVLLLICINFYLLGMRIPLGVIKSAAGIYTQDKYAPIIQSLLNLGFSLVLVQYYGILGVLLGTLISNILVPLWNRPYIVYKYLFKKSPKDYFIKLFYYTFFLLSTFMFLKYSSSFISLSGNISSLVMVFTICVFSSAFLFCLSFHKMAEFKFFLSHIILLISKVKTWKS